jgi:hypothetical protein
VPPRAIAPSFDRDAARQAWRQVARTRGAGAPLGGGGRTPSSLPFWAAAIAIVVAVAYAWYPSGSESNAPAASPTPPVATAPPPAKAAPAPMLAAATPAPVTGTVEDDIIEPRGRGKKSRAAGPRARKRRAREAAKMRRRVPAGTTDERAEAFRKLPHGRGDGTPMGGIGAEGVHVDEMSVGDRYHLGRCEGQAKSFSMKRHDKIHTCIRVVHRRVHQQVVIRWERDGHLVRRQWLPVPPAHAFRTRASLPVRMRFRGSWVVRVLSDDGIELATHRFEIED